MEEQSYMADGGRDCVFGSPRANYVGDRRRVIQLGGGGYPGIPLCGLYASKHSLPSVLPHPLSRSLLTFCPHFSVLETFSSSYSVVDLVLAPPR